MNTVVALLRGINVGGHHKLPMKELVSILESLGYEDIRTYIQSGNVVLCSAGPIGDEEAKMIGRRIHDEKGFEPRVLLLSADQWREAIRNNPFPTEVGKALHFYFTSSPPPAPDMARLESLRASTERVSLIGSVLYLYAPDGIGHSKLAEGVEKALGVPATARNWNTVEKITAIVDEV